ncbi:hypothetical protein [Xylophilus sp. ASV27]|uniref:hypothetical protein n=1 Tax=Xylophilus sp. ASV27 TaxID=2795129 RepID=UPI001E5E42FD|nr:hypothetical protein [Xylophilus sp. ASV27]
MRAVAVPEALEDVVHEDLVECRLALRDDGAFHCMREFRGIVRALTGDRIVEHHRAGHAHHQAAAGQASNRLAHRRREGAAEKAVGVGEFHLCAARGLPGQKTPQDLQGAC